MWINHQCCLYGSKLTYSPAPDLLVHFNMRLFLQTPKADMCSKLGMDLKRTMLLRLARRDPKLHPDDPARREAIYNKYQVGACLAIPALLSAVMFAGCPGW